MVDRLEAELSDRDQAAIRTALLKAVLVGMHVATVDVAAQVIEQAPGASVNLNQVPIGDVLARCDLWAAEYGDDA